MKFIIVLLTFILSVFASEDIQSEIPEEDNTDEITIIVMSVVFGSVIIVSVLVALILFIQQKKRKAEDYNAL